MSDTKKYTRPNHLYIHCLTVTFTMIPNGSICLLSRYGIKATNDDRQGRLLIASIKGDFMLCMSSPRVAIHGPDDCLYTAYSHAYGCSGMV